MWATTPMLRVRASFEGLAALPSAGAEVGGVVGVDIGAAEYTKPAAAGHHGSPPVKAAAAGAPPGARPGRCRRHRRSSPSSPGARPAWPPEDRRARGAGAGPPPRPATPPPPA